LQPLICSGEKTLFDPSIDTLLFFVLGAIFGSFGNVIIYRLPKGESVVLPGSHCQKCGKPVAWYDNIPIISWLVLRGKCRHCSEKFSIRYMIVEIVMGLCFALVFHFVGWKWLLLEYLIFIFGLVVCSFIDLDHYILPDVFTLSGIVIGLVGAALNPERSFYESLGGVLMGGGFLWLTAYLYYLFTKVEGMGGGDIKLIAWIGAVLGWQAVPFVIIISALTGSVVGLVMSRKQKKGLKAVIPYGPFLAAGALLYIFGLKELASWYISLFLPGLL
jgi:leader peptidase (prepilin peptidase)/N-methyltransferase